MREEMQMFESVTLLKKRVKQEHLLEVFHSGYTWKASFQWSQPADAKIVLQLQLGFGNRLPKDYVHFLSTISNGAVLFYDVQFGQWGFKIYGASELAEKQSLWQKIIPSNWDSHCIIFGELYGEANAMAFDLNDPTPDGQSMAILEANALDTVDNWPTASRSFHEWIDHLITAQGDKYWTWR